MDLPKRKSTRLKNYDYSSCGAYFITICTQNKEKILSHIVGEGFPLPKLSPKGEKADKLINFIPEKYEHITVDKYVIMPNHIHFLLSIKNQNGRGNPSPTIENVIGWFKYQSTKEINAAFGTSGKTIYQRSFYDHIIRNEQDYKEIWNYIENNPIKWQEDCFYIK